MINDVFIITKFNCNFLKKTYTVIIIVIIIIVIITIIIMT